MTGFVPPPYPHDRLRHLHALAGEAGDLLDLSVGSPCDPVPEVVVAALARAGPDAAGYPTSPGSESYRDAARGWMERRLGVEVPVGQIAACVGTKEVVAGLPRMLSLRDPSRDTVLYPAVAYPTYAMGARLAGLRAVPAPLDDAWRPEVSRIDEADAARALVLWLNEPGNPTGSVADDGWYAEVVAWARERGIVVASDECYAEFVFDRSRSSVLGAGSDGLLAVHSLSKRSNMAGYRVGFVAGDADLVAYIAEVRRHAGLMVAAPVQAAAAAALADDEHVDVQVERYRGRRSVTLAALEGTGLRHAGGSGAFYLWLEDEAGRDAWALAEEMARAGVVVAPGDLYGEEPARHVRVALVAEAERLGAAFSRLGSRLAAG